MKIFFSYLIVILSLTGCVSAGKNSGLTFTKEGYFPIVQGSDLNGDERLLPKGLVGDYNVVTVTFEGEQQDYVKPWIKSIRKILDSNIKLRFYQVLITDESNYFSRSWFNNKTNFKTDTDAEKERTIIVYTNRELFIVKMNMQPDTIHTILMDKKGKIFWRTSGKTTKNKVTSLQKTLKYIQK